MADISANITKSLQGLSNIPVGDLAAGIQQFSDAVAAGSQTLQDNNVTGRQYNQILKAQAEANKRYIKDEKNRFKDAKRKYKEENTLWQRATKQNKEHLKAQQAMIKGMKTANRELTMYGRAQAKLMSGLQRGAGAAGAGITKLAGKAGALGLVVVALKTLVDKILEADQILINMSKSTGQFRDALRPAADRASMVANQLAMAGVSMKEIAESSLGFLNNLTQTNRDYSKFLGTATMVSKAFGIGAEQSSKFFATIAEATTISGENMEKMVDDLVAFSSTGTNVARVMRDMTANSNLIAVYGEKQVKNLMDMAKHAAKSGTNLQGMLGTMDTFGDFESAIQGAQDLNRWFGVSIDSARAYQVAFNNDAKEQTEFYDGLIDRLARSTKLGQAFNREQLRIFRERNIDPQEIRLRQLLIKQETQQLDDEEKANLKNIKDSRKLKDLVREQQTLWQKIQTIITGPLNVFLRNIGEYLEKNMTPIIDGLAKTMDSLFDGKKLKEQVASGDLSGALSTAFAPLKTILIQMLEDVLKWFGDHYEFNLISMAFERKESPKEKQERMLGAARSRAASLATAKREGLDKWGNKAGAFDSPLFRALGISDKQQVETELAKAQAEIVALEKSLGITSKSVKDTGGHASFMPMINQALGGVHGRGRAALVGEAGGEVVISRSALRNGIGVGGRAASALAGIGVPGFANGFSSTYKADTSGTRTSQQTWASGRTVRGQFGAAASMAQNAPLREFQESVYQFRLSSIAYTEAMRANIQQQRQLPRQLIAAVNMGIKAIGGAVMGKSGSSMLNFAGGSGQTMKYMNIFNQLGLKGGGQAVGQGLLGQLGFAAEGKYVNSPTLMMVGEENRGEVVIPTERIRKGLPINAGVARELGSIGVPGFAGLKNTGISTSGSGGGVGLRNTGSLLSGNVSANPLGVGIGSQRLRGANIPIGGDLGQANTSRYGKGSAFADAGGFSGVGRMAAGQGLMSGLGSAFNTWQQGGTSEQVLASGITSGLSAGIGMGATALLTPVLGPFAPMVGGMLGSAFGKYAGPWISKKLGANDPKFGKYRKQAMKILKSHVSNRLPLEPGIPHGLGKAMSMGIAGRFGKPTPESQSSMRNELMKNFPNLSNREAIGFINMVTGAESNPKAYAYFNKDFGLPAAMEFAKGGVVNKATNAIIGEAGPEAVVPLENSELVREMKEIRKATQQLVKIIGDGKTTITLDGRVLAESTGLQMYDIAQGM